MTKSNNHHASEAISSYPLIETRSLSLTYAGKLAFRDISMTIPQGRITAIVGPSGCGKSSFLSCLNRLSDLIAGCKVSGSIYLKNQNIGDRRIDPTSLRRQVGTIFQKPNPFPMSIYKNIAFPLKEHGIKDPRQIARLVETTLQDVGLWSEVKDRLRDNALSLSGGQRQRLCIARTLALRPEIILMDEPCSALDPISSGIVEDLIFRLSREHNYTIVIVTHNLAQARRIADYAALFWVKDGCGKLIESARAEQFFHSPNCELTAAYINGIKG